MDAANARAAMQANIVDHGAANLVQPSSAKQESQNRARTCSERSGEKSKFWRICAFLPSAGRLKSNSIDPRSPAPGRAITMMNRNQGRVHCKLCPAEQREAFRNNFNAGAQKRERLPPRQIRAPMLSTTNPVCPEPLLYCTLRWWAETNRVDGHTGRCEKHRAKANGRGATKTHGTNGVLVASWDGVATNAAPANGPLWDRNKTCSFVAQPAQKELTMLALNPGKRLMLPPSFRANQDHTAQMSRRGGRSPSDKCGPRWGFEPFHPPPNSALHHVPLLKMHMLCLLPTH